MTKNTNLNELSASELRALVAKQQEELAQKDRQIAHLSKNARKWVQKFDQHQTSVAENVIKKFELEFEHERNELHAKLAKLSQLNARLVARYRKLELAASKPAATVPEQPETKLPMAAEPEIEINMLAEPASITEIEFSNEMKDMLSKYVR